MPGETEILKRFHSNTIKFVLDGKVAEARDEERRHTIMQQLREAMQLVDKPRKLVRIMSNADQPTVPQLVAAAQVFGVPLDDLIKLEDVPVAQEA